MNIESSFDTKDTDQELTQLQIQTPIILEQFSHAFGSLMGKDVKVPSKSNIERINKKMVRLFKVAKEIEVLTQHEITPLVATQLLLLLNRLFRLLATEKIPKDMEPVDYAISVMHSLAAEPIWEQGSCLQEINCSEKYQIYLEFIKELVQTTDVKKLDDFINEAASGDHLVPQFQKAFNKILVPKELERLPKNNTVKAAERIKGGLRIVLADWEGLINLVYGLKLLKEGKEEPWNEIGPKPLRKKVNEITNEELLRPLATTEWVIVRNSLAHGTAFFEPRRKEICFIDRNQQVSWGLQKARIEGLNIFLSNFVIMGTWIFVNAERGKNFEQKIDVLRELANTKM